jgi:ribosomal protein S18 acetylase RimI-like enzyme
MFGAQRLYERMGFKDIAPYYQSPVAGTRFLALDLDEIGKAGNEHV